MKYILASGNKHKAIELAALFEECGSVDVEAAKASLDVVEDGSSYEENALKKAEAYYQKYQSPVVSDDSGLEVRAMPDELGLHSARFGGEGLTDDDRVNLLLEKMESISDRSAYFICVLCFYKGPGEVFFFQGRVHGEIARDKKGVDGFGYDPIFIPVKHDGDETLAEIPDWKFKNSHRGRAVAEAVKFFED